MNKPTEIKTKLRSEEPEDEKDNVVALRPITGGKGSGDGNWLGKLEPQTQFLAKPKLMPDSKQPYREFQVMHYDVVVHSKSGKYTWLEMPLNNNLTVVVDNRQFSKEMDLVEEL